MPGGGEFLPPGVNPGKDAGGWLDLEHFFIEQLGVIERAIRSALRRASSPGDDAEDFASYVKLKLIENDYAVLRKYEGRSSFGAFISVVVQRLLADYRIARWGKWHPSAQARRLGEPAMTVETMLVRDRRPLDEALPELQRQWPHLTRDDVEAIAVQLPERTQRPRAVDVDLARVADCRSRPDEMAAAAELGEIAGRIGTVIRAGLDQLDITERLILRLRFEGGVSVAEIARMLNLEQKPLYRRMNRALGALRKQLEFAGFGSRDVEDVLSSATPELNFGLDDSEADSATPGSEECS